MHVNLYKKTSLSLYWLKAPVMILYHNPPELLHPAIDLLFLHPWSIGGDGLNDILFLIPLSYSGELVTSPRGQKVARPIDLLRPFLEPLSNILCCNRLRSDHCVMVALSLSFEGFFAKQDSQKRIQLPLLKQLGQ